MLGAFFYRIYEFLFTLDNPPPVIHKPQLPERYTIRFVPATGAAAHQFLNAGTVPTVSVNSSPGFSIVSSANFVVNALPGSSGVNAFSHFSAISHVSFPTTTPAFSPSCIEPNT